MGEAGAAEIERVTLGRRPVAMTRFVLGCAPLAGLYRAVSSDQAAETLESAWSLGVRAFDTAPHYGAGKSERRLGAFLADKDREDFVVSTKVGRLLVPAPKGPHSREFVGEPPVERVRDYSADGVRRSLESSLERLGLDRVDVALVHDPEGHLDEVLAGAFPALEALRDEGVVGAVGAGTNTTAPLAQLVRAADLDCVLIAGRFTLLDQEALEELLPACEARGVTVLAAGVFNGDILADPRPGAHFDYEPASKAVLARARRAEEICAHYGVPLAAAAVRFPLRHPVVGAVVVGARSPEEVGADVGYLSAEIPDDVFAELEALRLRPSRR